MIEAAGSQEDSSTDLKQLLPFFKDCLKVIIPYRLLFNEEQFQKYIASNIQTKFVVFQLE